MKSFRIAFIVAVLLVCVGAVTLANVPITDSTVLYLHFSDEGGEPVGRIEDIASGLNAMAVQYEGKPLIYGDANPLSANGSIYFSNAATSDDDGSFLYIADAPELDFDHRRELTLEVIISPDAYKQAVLLRKTEPGGEAGYLLAMDEDGGLVFQLQSETATERITTRPGVLLPGEWSHVAALWGGGRMLLYVNGEIEAEGEFDAYLEDTSGHLGIGAHVRTEDLTSWGDLFHGSFGGVRISNVILGPDELLKQ